MLNVSRQDEGQRAAASAHGGGFGIIPLLAAFAVISALCLLWTKSSIARARDLALREERIQAQWLAEAGVRRGAARLVGDGSYDGEVWMIAAAELGRRAGARVVISIESASDATGEMRILARASYPDVAERVAASKSVTFTLPSGESSP